MRAPRLSDASNTLSLYDLFGSGIFWAVSGAHFFSAPVPASVTKIAMAMRDRIFMAAIISPARRQHNSRGSRGAGSPPSASARLPSRSPELARREFSECPDKGAGRPAPHGTTGKAFFRPPVRIRRVRGEE